MRSCFTQLIPSVHGRSAARYGLVAWYHRHANRKSLCLRHRTLHLPAHYLALLFVVSVRQLLSFVLMYVVQLWCRLSTRTHMSMLFAYALTCVDIGGLSIGLRCAAVDTIAARVVVLQPSASLHHACQQRNTVHVPHQVLPIKATCLISHQLSGRVGGRCETFCFCRKLQLTLECLWYVAPQTRWDECACASFLNVLSAKDNRH